MNKLYRCDPDKNTPCKKNWCYRNGHECYRTIDKQYKMTNIFKRTKEFVGGILWKMKTSKD